jgi:beta-phosphoglucomutase
MLSTLGLADEFDATVSGEDVTAGKPDPQVFLAAASRLEAQPRDCIVVEDAAMGIEAARRACMRSIGVNRKARLDGANLAVTSLADLPLDAFRTLLGK